MESTSGIETLIEGRPRDLGDFEVARLLPSAACRLVGPFLFFDHFGPVDFAPGRGMDVRPHPHINLATVTYLFEGEILHRDSLGSLQAIRPGAINWMTAGRGIVHSERSPPEVRATGSRLHGIQLWVALPQAHEETEPEFHHHDAESLPTREEGGVRLRILAGEAFGAVSPVRTFSPLFYVEAVLGRGERLPLPGDHEERALYVVEGSLAGDGARVNAGTMAVLSPRSAPMLRAETAARVMLLGGAPMDGPRHIWWNFASSSEDRIEKAKRDWKEGRFPKVPGDEAEFIPLP